MRLFELTNSNIIPNPQDFVTKELVSRIIKTGKWVDHGSMLSDHWDEWVEQGIGEQSLPSDMETDYTKGINDPRFPDILFDWLKNFRAPYISYSMRQLTAVSKIWRFMYVKKQFLSGLMKSSLFGVGIYWSTHSDGDAYDASVNIQNTHPIKIMLETTLGNVSVDWKNTFESRFDYMHGDQEEEIQLIPGSPISSISVYKQGKWYGEHELLVSPVDIKAKLVA